MTLLVKVGNRCIKTRYLLAAKGSKLKMFKVVKLNAGYQERQKPTTTAFSNLVILATSTPYGEFPSCVDGAAAVLC